MRSAKPLHISRKAAATLNQWCRSTTLPHGQIMRAKIILQLSEGMTPTDVAMAQRTTAKTVYRWRNRFEAEGILMDCNGQERKCSGCFRLYYSRVISGDYRRPWLSGDEKTFFKQDSTLLG